MNTKIQILILFFLVAFLNNPSSAFPGMGGQNSSQINNLTNITGSDQDIVLVQHLIELNATLSENNPSIKETLVFKNIGTKNFSGSLSTWVPDDATNVGVAKIEMMTTAEPTSLTTTSKKVTNGNIISWGSTIQSNSSLPPMYAVVYQVPFKKYTKIFLYPAETKQPTNSIVLKVTMNKGDTAAVTDGNGNNLTLSARTQEDANSTLYGWDSPQFTELNVVITKSAVVTPTGNNNLGVYILLGILILLVLSYPLLRTKSGKLREFEDTIKGSIKKEEKKEGRTLDENVSEKPESKKKALKGNNTEKKGLETEKDELLSKLGALDKKYASGDLMDEEYEELRKPYQKRLKEIKKLMGS
jgi:hypothetical protein